MEVIGAAREPPTSALIGETRYIYDGMRVIQERNASNTPTVSYTRGWDLSGSLEGAGGIGGLLGRSHGYSSGTWSTHNHYHADGNGNVTFLVNSGQTAEAWYRYDPYGRTMAQSATALTTDNLYRFSSKEIHAQSGMYYYGFRFYDPHLQRWPNHDGKEVRAEGFVASYEGGTALFLSRESIDFNIFANAILVDDDSAEKKEKFRREAPGKCRLLRGVITLGPPVPGVRRGRTVRRVRTIPTPIPIPTPIKAL